MYVRVARVNNNTPSARDFPTSAWMCPKRRRAKRHQNNMPASPHHGVLLMRTWTQMCLKSNRNKFNVFIRAPRARARVCTCRTFTRGSAYATASQVARLTCIIATCCCLEPRGGGVPTHNINPGLNRWGRRCRGTGGRGGGRLHCTTQRNTLSAPACACVRLHGRGHQITALP